MIEMPQPRRRCALQVVGCLLQMLLLLSSSELQAQQAPVRLKMEPLSLRTRSGGPIGMQAKLEYNETNILEGDLVLKVYDGPREAEILLTTIRYEDLVLQGSDLIFNILLPPLQQTGSQSYEVAARFETGTESFALSASAEYKDPPDPFSIIGNTMGARGLVLCSASGRADPSRVSERRSRLHDVLSAQALVPEEYAQSVVYFPAPRAGSSMPENPLDLCCYDAVLLTDGALKQLESTQLEALASWTEAGGSLCVAPTDAGHSRRHLEFLRRMLPRHVNQLRLAEDGRISFPTDQALYCADYAELGRCVLISPEFDRSTRVPVNERSGLSSFFWKARGTSIPAPGEAFLAFVPHWKRQPTEPQQPVGKQGAIYGPGNRPLWDNIEGLMSPRESEYGRTWQSILMPSDVRMVPTGVIAGLLLAFVVAVGPVDYWLLGLLRMRKYTWIVFPLVTLAFTVAMVGVAHHYLGSNETGGRVVVTDVGAGGRVIRESVLNQLFLGTRREVSTDVTAGLVSSLQRQPLILNGRFPQKYSADRRVEQWTPEMLRTLSLSADPIRKLPIDWDDTDLVTTESGRSRLREILLGDEPAGFVFAVVLHESEGMRVYDRRPSVAQNNRSSKRSEVQMSQRGVVQHPFQFGARADLKGFFQYVSQISPSGNAELEDFPIHDVDNPDQWVLAILLRTEDGYHIIRRSYHITEADM
jgi:hypothetical protein